MRRASSGFHEIETFLDPLDPRIETVHPTVNASQTFLDMGDAHLQILNIVTDTTHALFNARKPQLNLLQDRNDNTRDFAHD